MEPASGNALGILDFGIGGLGFYKKLREHGDQRNICYFSDAGHFPYGTLSRKQLCERLSLIFDYFADHSINEVFVACNAASTVLDEVKHTRVKAKGIIEYGICSVTETGCKTVWVIGGGRTIRSGIFRKKLEEKGLVVTQKITQELSILIEKGDVSSFSLESLIRIYLGGMETNTCLLLACTHYPAALPLFRKVVPENVQILDPSDKASETLALRHNKTLGKGSTQFVTSGIPGEMIARANATFAVPVENVLKVSL